MIKSRIEISVFLLLLTISAKAGEHPSPVFLPPPRIAITADEFSELKSKPEFATIKESAVKAAQALLDHPVTLPDGFGSWVSYYACPDDGSYLRAITAAEHECPKCKKRYSDERTIAAYRGILHTEAENAALKLAWALLYTSDKKYAAEVKRILLKFADDYPTYPARIDRWGRRGFFAPLGGRRRVQSLEEAEGIIPLAKAYDLTRSSAIWTDNERAHVESNLFRATADTLSAYPMALQNRQAWYNAGLLAIGSVLGDAEIVNKALFGANGFEFQLVNGVGDDGFWWEGTMAYQSYVVRPMLETVDIARRVSIKLQDNPRFKNLLASPVKATYPDGTFPCINDSDPADMHLFDFSFEWAWKTYKDPVFAQALAWKNPAKLTQLLGGSIPAVPLDISTTDLPSIGLLFLRAGEGPNAVCVTNHYGSPGGDATDHGHWDKLSITLFAKGREWLSDIGRLGYTHKEYTSWAKRTIAHNTVTINQVDQSISTGKLLWLKKGDGFAAAAVESTQSYPNTVLRRYMYLNTKMFIDVFEVKTLPHSTIDFAIHTVRGGFVPARELKSINVDSLGNANGYQHIKNIIAYHPSENTSWTVTDDKDANQKLCVHFPAWEDETIFTATGIGFSPDQSAPCLISRRKGGEARFVNVYDLSGDTTFIKSIDSSGGGPAEITVRDAEKVQRYVFGDEDVKIQPAK